MKQPKYKYIFSASYNYKNGVGNIESRCKKKLTTKDDLDELKKLIITKNPNIDNVSVTNIIYFTL